MGNSVCSSLNQRLTVAALVLIVAGWAHAADPPSDAKPSVPPLLQKMEGNWTVSEKVWLGRGQQAVDLPAATAHRRLIQESFIEELMESTQARRIRLVQPSVLFSADSPNFMLFRRLWHEYVDALSSPFLLGFGRWLLPGTAPCLQVRAPRGKIHEPALFFQTGDIARGTSDGGL